MKQANHEMSNRVEQSQIQEQLKMQYECSSSDTSADELEIRMENVENELKIRSKEYTDSLVTISALEGHAKRLEEELEKQARGFEADLEALTSEKVEQEKRAIRAEEMLKKMRWKNANTAERLQEEFRRLSVQMASTFEANERLATNALAEANELRLQKGRLEETLRKSYEELESIKGDYETRLHQLMNQIEQMQTEIEDKAARLEDQKLLSDEILMLRDEIESHVAKNKILSDEMASKKSLMHEVEQMRMLVKEKELLLEQANDERIELERMVESVKNEADESRKELNEMRCLLKDKEMIVSNLESEVESLRARCTEFKDARLEDETEIEKLSKQVIQLKSDMKKKEDAFNSTEKKIKDGNGRGMIVDVAKATSKTSKPVFRASKEVANLKERIKLLESQIKSKETALETSTNKFLEKEKDLHYKIKELEGRLQSSARFCENEVDKPASAVVEDQAPNYRAILSLKSNDLSDDELRDEMALLKEKNKSMEEDLMEMQEKYLDISLKFAEVEGERQQLNFTIGAHE
ncbi:hypothetical protein DH2020_036219 [Rehmannia glutinosa]|uniref:Uncharacterized protein n=1 Tax=Rehmannia glutinosa TaxID=99300 RepID=A0ABR0V5A4_REHGL